MGIPGWGGGSWVNACWVCDTETSIQGTPSGPSHMSPQWGLAWGLFIINQQIKYFFLSFCLGICCSLFQATSECIKDNDELISAMLPVEFPQVQYINLSEIVHVVKAVSLCLVDT